MNKHNWFEQVCLLMFINLGALGRGMCYATFITHTAIGHVDSPRKAILCMIYFGVIELAGIIGLEVTSD